MASRGLSITVTIEREPDGRYCAQCDVFIDGVSPLGFGATPYEALREMAEQLTTDAACKSETPGQMEIAE